MPTKLETYNQLKAELVPVAEQWVKYFQNKVKLKYTDAKDLESKYYQLQNKIRENCPHEEVVAYEDVYTDVGYGLDRHYKHWEIFCGCCNNQLLNTVDYPSNTSNFGWSAVTGTLDECIAYVQQREPIREDTLKNLGYRLHREVITKTELRKI